MSELTFKSAGVSTREIDLSGPTTIRPQGVPAGVIGTAQKGPAFVPVTVATFADFVAEFGATDGKKFGPLAMSEWLKNARAGTYVRVLGTGDAKRRDSGTGRVKNAGFIVGAQLPQNTDASDGGALAANPYAFDDDGEQIPGRTYFLGAFMKEAAGSTAWVDAGLDTTTEAKPVIRAVIMTPRGVHPTLKCATVDKLGGSSAEVALQTAVVSAISEANSNGSQMGLVELASAQDRFTILLNGHKNTSTYPANLTCSFDPQAPDYFMNILNSDPACIEEAGHCVYAHYDIQQSFASVSVTGLNYSSEITTVTLPGESSIPSGDGIGKYFDIYNVSNSLFRVWFNVDIDADSNGDRTPPADGGGTLVEVLIASGDSASTVATAVKNAVDALTDFSASVDGDIVTIEVAGTGNTTNADAGTMVGLGTFAISTTDGGSIANTGTAYAAAFLVHGKNVAGALVEDGVYAADISEYNDSPNYEDFQERFQTARSPWVISQAYGSKPKNLFKFHALDDGTAGSGKFKITISNVMLGPGEEHGQFDVFVRDIADDDIAPRVFEKFIGLDLNPNSERYIARVIGDQHMYYDFDRRQGSQKLVVEGIHPARSKYIRVEMAPEVDAGSVPRDALPLGYRGYNHLVTDANELAAEGVRYLQDGLSHIASLGSPSAGSIINDAIEPPVPMRLNIAEGSGLKKRAQVSFCWGTMFQIMDNATTPNSNTKFDATILSHCKFFPSHTLQTPAVSVGDNSGTKVLYDGSLILDSDKFNNNLFSLERIQIITKNPTFVSLDNPKVKGKIDHKQWAVAEYRRNGELNESITTVEGAEVDIGIEVDNDSTYSTRFLDPRTDLKDPVVRRYMKFSFFLQGGFDGVNIFNPEKAELSNRAAVWEMDDDNQGGVEGPTIAAFRKALDVMAEKSDVDIKLLAIPGMRDEAITDYAIDSVESRFDAMYIMDIEEKSVDNELMIDYDTQNPSVNLTVEELKSRNLDSSFAAAYFPDVVITDPVTSTNVQCPPSVAVLGAFSLNDAIAHPWYAPAGFTRGALSSVVEAQVKLSRKNLDSLYESDINPLTAFPHTPGVVVWGQKTLQQAQSALDRVNVRRLLIEIRREVRRIGNGLLFEPNRADTLARFSAAVNPVLQRIQQQQGLDRFKVVIDTTTTTQADVENNTIRGKIFLQPTRTVEFISLDFVVTNAGMQV